MGYLWCAHQLHLAHLYCWLITFNMSSVTLLEKIKKDAATAAEEIASTAAEEASVIERETEAAVKKLQEDHKAQLVRKKEQLERVAVSKAKQSNKIALQQAKRDQLDAVFAEVTKKLSGQSSDEYVAFFTRQAKSVLAEKVEAVRVLAPANRVEETKSILGSLGISAEVTGDDSIVAGFVLHAKDGVYDVTLARLISEKRSELEMMVVEKVLS